MTERFRGWASGTLGPTDGRRRQRPKLVGGFGPSEVTFVVGRNKIVPTVEDALIRAKEAAAKLAEHYRRKTPCVKTGRCTECLSADCVCPITTIHRKNPIGRVHSVFLVNEDLGLWGATVDPAVRLSGE